MLSKRSVNVDIINISIFICLQLHGSNETLALRGHRQDIDKHGVFRLFFFLCQHFKRGNKIAQIVNVDNLA